MTIPQNLRRARTKLALPVLAIGGADNLGSGVAGALRLGAADVRELVLPDCGHWVAEEAPDSLLAGLLPFLR
ncbi:pimeloyl-ACP methyl ester carboxylesterase [Crossiella equi]|uniref:Pimeloyl-ACP methyl ester carboxylesterase n=1 Tax=Crossiella equi TaxID=130796 RepID=A0ABS5A632_9PSEU|nr:alpha/beta hydrolase [Crossiella equi]MBP2472050.1 pimeloyl-ACP methyl ester carboxylesterase [Crossiella equi]